MNSKIIVILIILGVIGTVVFTLVFTNKYLVLGSKVYDKRFVEDNKLLPSDLVAPATQTTA